MKRLLALGAAMGAALAYFFDPETATDAEHDPRPCARLLPPDRARGRARRTGSQVAGLRRHPEGRSPQGAVEGRARYTSGTPAPTRQS